MIYQKVKMLRGSATEIDAVIMAAKMDGCWDVLCKHRGVACLDGDDTYDHRLVSWISDRDEQRAWDRLVEIAEKIGRSQEGWSCGDEM